jgi:hypothetical protein
MNERTHICEKFVSVSQFRVRRFNRSVSVCVRLTETKIVVLLEFVFSEVILLLLMDGGLGCVCGWRSKRLVFV